MGEIIWAVSEKNNLLSDTLYYLRSYAVNYCEENDIDCHFEIPEGYQVESIPKVMKIATDDKSLVFSINSMVQGNNVQIAVVKEINIGKTSADTYDGLKGFYQKMIEKQHDKIVLKKIRKNIL